MESNDQLRNIIADRVWNRERGNLTPTAPNSTAQVGDMRRVPSANDFVESQIPTRHLIAQELAKKFGQGLKTGANFMKDSAVGVLKQSAQSYGTAAKALVDKVGEIPQSANVSEAGKAVGETSITIGEPQITRAKEPTIQTEATIGQGPTYTAKDFVWQEGKFMPYMKLPDGEIKEIKDFQTSDFVPLSSPIQKITITENGETHEITDPKRLEVANQIAMVARAVAPEYENYLLRLANFEGLLEKDTRNYMANNKVKNSRGRKVQFSSRNVEDMDAHGGLWSTDRGVFQINDAAFPAISDEIADDPVRATLFVISAIEAGKQKKWLADERTKNAQLTYE